MGLAGGRFAVSFVDQSSADGSGSGIYARVFEAEEESLKAIVAGKIRPGDVIVIRHEGPRGGPGSAQAGLHQ